MSCAEFEAILDTPEALRSPAEKAAWDAHLQTCDACAQKAQTVSQAFTRALEARSLEAMPQVSSDFRARLSARMREASAETVRVQPPAQHAGAAWGINAQGEESRDSVMRPPEGRAMPSRSAPAVGTAVRPGPQNTRHRELSRTAGMGQWLTQRPYSLGAALLVLMALPLLWQSGLLKQGSEPTDGATDPIQFKGNAPEGPLFVELRLLSASSDGGSPQPVAEGSRLELLRGLLMRFDVKGAHWVGVWVKSPAGTVERLFERSLQEPGRPATSEVQTIALGDSADNPLQYLPDHGKGHYSFMAAAVQGAFSAPDIDARVAEALGVARSVPHSEDASVSSAAKVLSPLVAFSKVQVIYE